MTRLDEYTNPDFVGEEPLPPGEAEARREAARKHTEKNGKPKPSERIDLVDLAQRKRVQVPHIVEGLIPQGSLVALGGYAKRSKSTMALHLVRKVSCGEPFIDCMTEACSCLYLNGEMAPDYMKTLAEQIVGRGDPEEIKAAKRSLCACDVVERTPKPFTMERLYVETSPYAEAGLVVLDSFRAFWAPSGDDENKTGFVGRILRAIADWCHETGWTCIIIQHFGKYASGDDEGSLAGSGEWAASCDVLWIWKRALNEDIGRLRVSGRIPPVEDIAVELSPTRCRAVGSPTQARKNQRIGQILARLPEDESAGWTYDDIQERVFPEEKIALKTIKAIVGEMLDSGKLRRVGSGTKSSPYRHWQDSVPSPLLGSGDGMEFG